MYPWHDPHGSPAPVHSRSRASAPRLGDAHLVVRGAVHGQSHASPATEKPSDPPSWIRGIRSVCSTMGSPYSPCALHASSRRVCTIVHKASKVQARPEGTQRISLWVATIIDSV